MGLFINEYERMSAQCFRVSKHEYVNIFFQWMWKVTRIKYNFIIAYKLSIYHLMFTINIYRGELPRKFSWMMESLEILQEDSWCVLAKLSMWYKSIFASRFIRLATVDLKKGDTFNHLEIHPFLAIIVLIGIQISTKSIRYGVGLIRYLPRKFHWKQKTLNCSMNELGTNNQLSD